MKPDFNGYEVAMMRWLHNRGFVSDREYSSYRAAWDKHMRAERRRHEAERAAKRQQMNETTEELILEMQWG